LSHALARLTAGCLDAAVRSEAGRQIAASIESALLVHSDGPVRPGLR
jgi:hypothetical protein